MKTKSIIRIVLLSLFVSLGFALTAHARTYSGDSFSSYGKYTFEKAKGQLVVNGKAYKTYVVQYENREDPVLIIVDHEKECRNYIVKAKDFEVQYQCIDGQFGVQLTNEKYAWFEENYVVDKIDNIEFSYQSEINPKSMNERKMVELIAAYYPELKK